MCCNVSPHDQRHSASISMSLAAHERLQRFSVSCRHAIVAIEQSSKRPLYTSETSCKAAISGWNAKQVCFQVNATWMILHVTQALHSAKETAGERRTLYRGLQGIATRSGLGSLTALHMYLPATCIEVAGSLRVLPITCSPGRAGLSDGF